MRKFDDLVKSPLMSNAPDTQSMIAAARVQMLLAAGNHASPVDYIMDYYGDTREEAEAIVKNCRAESDLG